MRGEYQFPLSIYYKTSAILQQIRYIKSFNLHLNLYTFTTFRAIFPFPPFFSSWKYLLDLYLEWYVSYMGRFGRQTCLDLMQPQSD